MTPTKQKYIIFQYTKAPAKNICVEQMDKEKMMEYKSLFSCFIK